MNLTVIPRGSEPEETLFFYIERFGMPDGGPARVDPDPVAKQAYGRRSAKLGFRVK